MRPAAILAAFVTLSLAACSTAPDGASSAIQAVDDSEVSSTQPETTTSVAQTTEDTADVPSIPTEETESDPPPATDTRPDGPSARVMNIENTLSDQAQVTTIAFDALAFMTGNLCTDSFFPPGKVSDFFGFQYLRDNEPDAFGHNTAFAATVGENILYLLDDEQVGQLVELATVQIADINEYAYARFPIIDAFRRLLDDELPEGSSGLSTSAVADYSAEVYGLDGQISFERASVIADILNDLTPAQAEQLAALAATGVAQWPDRGQDAEVEAWKRQLDPESHVALMTIAGQLYSWYSGGIEADTYFCPERHGTYFGSFYMKDIPAMLSQQAGSDVTINENLTGAYGDRFLDVLSTDQRALIEGLADNQRPLMEELVATREAIATQLRRLWDEPNVDQQAVESEVATLSARYGELDGQVVAMYASAFEEVYDSLSSDQVSTLWSFREDAEHLGLIDDPCSLSPDDLAYLYSHAIDTPDIDSTDGFFVS
ncbi:MAG: hypothetical protein GY708_27470 [Actinomycetia bacterium]|nr:hypothetical protein [Actinomycetes bacterium]